MQAQNPKGAQKITITGIVATEPRRPVSEHPHVTFRLARRPKKRSGQSSSETEWYTVVCFGSLEDNLNASIEKGQPVMVSGRPWIPYEPNQIVADSVGHDLSAGTSVFTRTHDNRRAQEAGTTS